MSQKTPVKISKHLYDKIKRRVEVSEGEFQSVEAYIEFVLTEVTKEEEPKKTSSPEEQEEIKKRLRSLGYL